MKHPLVSKAVSRRTPPWEWGGERRGEEIIGRPLLVSVVCGGPIINRVLELKHGHF